MVDRLYENMLILIDKNRKGNCNRTLCNLNVPRTIPIGPGVVIVIEHCVI